LERAQNGLLRVARPSSKASGLRALRALRVG